MNSVTRPHRSHLVQWAEQRPEVLVLSADLTSSCEADLFRDAYPERFFSMGMAEQNMIGFAAGLAREGFSPWVHTFAVFLTRRVFDQVAMSVAYPNLPVRLVGFLPGVTTPGGVTHQAIDDVALMRVLPNLTIVDTGDATEVLSALDAVQDVPGPVYLRMLRGVVPRLFPAAEPLVVGRSRTLCRGEDITVLSSSICTEHAMRAVAALRRRGVGVSHVHVSTLKPFPDQGVIDSIASAGRGVITVENHSVIGGLGSATAELMATVGTGTRLLRLGLQDRYAQGASVGYLLAKHGMDAPAVVRAAQDLLGRTLDIPEHELVADVTLPDDSERVEDL